MEGDNVEVPPSGGGSPATHRWNPTKEQITMLENLYKQGIRTPTAEQIQEITSRLKVYGHIEGKNVFYWFQNHKARQRQKQKQDHNNMANYFNRFLHHQPTPPFLSPPAGPNVVCSPYYLPQSDLGFYPQCPKLLLPGGRKRSPRLDKVDKLNPSNGGQSGQLGFHTVPPMGSSNIQETLSLFPLHPTGVLQERTTSLSLGSNSSENSIATATPSGSSETPTCNTCDQQEGAGDQHFFDFFCGKK